MYQHRRSLVRTISFSLLIMMGLLRTSIGIVGLANPLAVAKAQDWPLTTQYVRLFSGVLLQVGLWTLMAGWNTRDFYTTDWMSMRLLFVEMGTDGIALGLAFVMDGVHKATNIVWASICLTIFTILFLCTWKNARRHRFEPLLG
ncbi:MAG: hypothetical protein K0U52_13665 [Gammaproteobacteria bacterium]|nr:hypothetical protein [Gammaproteobacteria bacterium]